MSPLWKCIEPFFFAARNDEVARQVKQRTTPQTAHWRLHKTYQEERGQDASVEARKALLFCYLRHSMREASVGAGPVAAHPARCLGCRRTQTCGSLQLQPRLDHPDGVCN